MAPIAVGDKIPEGSLAYMDSEKGLQVVSVYSLAAGKKVILFGVPGAFTPTCRSLYLQTLLSLNMLCPSLGSMTKAQLAQNNLTST